MPEKRNESVPDAVPNANESRPVDLGLSEGKSMAFAPTSALRPEGPPIGGLAPAAPSDGAGTAAPPGGGDPSPTSAPAAEGSPSGEHGS